MSRSGVLGTIFDQTGKASQVAGSVLMFVPGAQPIALALLAIGNYQSAQYQKKKAKDDYNASLTDRYAMTSTYAGVRSRIYGRARNVDGVLFKATFGATSEWYTLVIAVAGHEVDAIEQVYFDDVAITIDPSTKAVTSSPYSRPPANASIVEPLLVSGSNQITLSSTPSGAVLVQTSVEDERGRTVTITPTSVSGKVATLPVGYAGQTVTAVYTHSDAQSYAYVRTYTGAPGQDLSTELAGRFPGLITSAHKFQGVALLLVDLLYSQDVFPSGVPNITALVRGAKVYDPRSSTTAWSDNPALCIRDWALYANGGGCSASEVDDASIIAAANACDVSHTYTDSAGTSTTRAMFKCGYVAKLDVSPETHLAELVESMGGKWGWAGGRLRVRAGAYQAPVMTLTDACISDRGGSRQIVPDLAITDVTNSYRITISDEAQSYNSTQLPVLAPSAYLTADTFELTAEIEMGAVQFSPQALHIGGILLRDQRQGMSVVWPCNMRAWPLELFDCIQINSTRYGWSGKTFEVLGWRHSLTAGVILSLKETDATIFDPDAVFSAVDQVPNTALPSPFNVPAVTGLAAQSGTAALQRLGDGTIMSRIQVSWDAISDAGVTTGGGVDVSVIDGSTGIERMYSIAGTESSLYVPDVSDGVAYLIRARARNPLVRGAWCAAISHTVVGKTEPPPTVDSFNISTQADGTRVLSGGYTANTKPYDFAGYRVRYLQGPGPYTFAQMQPFQTDDGFFTTLPIETNLLLAGEYTLAIVGVDTTGNESTTPLFITATLPNPRLGSAIDYVDEGQAGWGGTKSGCVLDEWSGQTVLRAVDQATWATLPSTWNAWTRWIWDPVTSFSYVTQPIDFGVSVAVLPVLAVMTSGVVTFEAATSSDGTTWSGWSAVAGTITTRWIKTRISVGLAGGTPTGAGVTPILSVSALQVTYVGKVSSETGNDEDISTYTGVHRIAAGHVRLPTQKTWAHISRVTVALQSVGAGWSWVLIDKNGTDGPEIKIYNGSGSLADPPLIDWTIEGIPT